MRKRIIVMVCFGASVYLYSASAKAQSCDNLAENASWADGMSALIYHIDKGEFDKAIEAAKPLFAICPKMPSLNYYTGLAFESQDPARALYYFQEAGKNTVEFTTSPAISRSIWYKLYEVEHPERTEAAISSLTQNNIRLNEVIAQRDEVIDEQKTTIHELEKELAESAHNTNQMVMYSSEEARQEFAKAMWAGTGVGIAGLIMAGAGISMVAFVTNHNDEGHAYSVSKPYMAGWSLIGIGGGLAVAGAIMAGIAGYQYTHFDVPNTDITISLGGTYRSIGLYMAF